MESSVSNSYQRPDKQSSSNTKSLVTYEFAGWAKSPDEVIEHCASSEATIHIDLSALPKKYQAKAKVQVLGNCYVKICDLASLVNNRQFLTERKAVKRPRDDTSPENNERFATARISSQGHYSKLTKKKHDESASYNVRNVSETRLIVKKKSLPEYEMPHCTPIRPELEYEESDIEPLPGPSQHYHNRNFISSVEPKFPFPRKNPSVQRKPPLAIHSESATRPVLDTFIDNSKRRVKNAGTQTEPQPQIDFLQRRISELELIIASNRSFQTPSPLLPKSQEDAGSALSTPPNSDSGSCTGHVDKKSETSSSKHNPTPSKSLHIVVNRLTDNDLRQYGVGLNSSVSPTEETRPKKRPRLSSLSDFEQRSSKKEKKIYSTKKRSDLFGDDSDDDVAPQIFEKPQPLDMDDLNYDFNDDEEESRASNVEKQAKVKETNHRDKSSKSDKKDRNSEKDRRKEKERRKKDGEKTKTGENSNSSKEKSAKESSAKSGKDQAVAGNVAKSGFSKKFTIPKKSAVTNGVGLPPLVQDGLDQLKKGPTPSPVQQTVSSRTSEPVPHKNLNIKSPDLAKVPSTSNNTVEQSVSSDSFEFSSKSAPTILCLPRESFKERNPKSVNFHEQLERVRVISPCVQLQEPEQIKEISSIREKYIPIIMNDLTYEPKSSPRDPVKGIRPFHPPNRRIEDDKLKILTQERGGRRFYAYSSSSSSDSDDATSGSESSEEINTNEHSEKITNEIFPPAKLCLTVENQSIANDSSIIPEELSSKPTAPESVESTMSMSLSSTNSGEFYTPSSAIEPVLMISVAVTSDSTRENISPAVTEEHTPAVIPKKLPSLAVPPSPRRQTPEPISQVPSTVVNAKSSIPMEEDESEDGEDILELDLNEGDDLDYEVEEPPRLLPSKQPSNGISNAPDKIVFDMPSPVKIAPPLNKTKVLSVPVKPTAIPRNATPNVANTPFFQDDSPYNRGFCFDFVRSGQCKVSDNPNKKCEYSHDLDSILDYITYMCTKKGNITSACRLVYCMTNSDSPLNKSLNEPLGFRIVETVIKFLMMGNQPNYALEMLCDKKLPLIREYVDAVVRDTQVSPASVNQLVNLYDRCQFFESNIHMMQLSSFKILIKVLVDNYPLRSWEFICKAVEIATSYYPQSYEPTKEVLLLLFREARDQSRLERWCNLFSGIGPTLLLQLPPELRNEILSRLRHFDLVQWYDTYAGIRRPMESEMHPMAHSMRPTQSRFVAPQQYPPNGMVNQPHRGAMPLLHRAQHPSNMPPVQQMQHPVRQPNCRPMQPSGLQRPLLPTPSLHRPQAQPPTFPVGVHRAQLPTSPPADLHRPQQAQHPTIPMVHPVRNMLYPPTTPPVIHSNRDPREKLARPVPHENGIGPGSSSSISHAELNPEPPSHVVSPVETKKAAHYVALEIPKPSHSLDLNLFEPESPEVEPYFHEEEEEVEEEQGAPLVVVEPSRGMEDELLTKFNEQNFKDVTEWYLRCYTGDRKCAMLAKLVHLIKTNPIYNVEDNNQQMSPGHIVFKILHSAFVDEEADKPKVLDPRQHQALLDLIFFVLYHFFQMSMTGDDEEKMANELLAKNFLELLVLFQQQLPMDDFIKHPGLLLFVAKCLLNIDWSKEEENDFLDEVVPQVERSIIFLTEFHVFVKNFSSSVDSHVAHEEFQLVNQMYQTIEDFGRFPDFGRFSGAVVGLLVDFKNAAFVNNSLLKTLLPSN